MDSANYKHIVAQIKKSSLLPHHIYPSHNHLSIDTLAQVCEENKFAGSFPCYVPFEYEVKSNLVFLPGCNATDGATDLVKRKLTWKKKLGSMEPGNLNSVIQSLKRVRRNKRAKLSDGVRKYAEHFFNDPEPYFNGTYNWLYTGGSLASVEENERTALVFSDYSGKKPGFSVVKLSESLDKVEGKCFYELKTFSPILQIVCKSRSENVACVRQKNQVSLLRIDETTALRQPTKLWRKKTVNDKLITCADVGSDGVVISDTNYDVHVFDVQTGTKTFGHTGKDFVSETVADHWAQVSFGSLGLLVAFRDRLHILDVRDADARPKLSFDPSAPTNVCEGISCVSDCVDSNHVYLATTHHLLQVDLRNRKPIQKWTHLMKSPPQFTSSTQLGEQELLLMQSWKVDEMVGVTNDRLANGLFVSKSLPCLLRSVKESLRLSRCQGTCLSPSLTKRVDFAVTGIKCLKSDRGEVFMFVQNSGGDVFLNKIRKKVEGVDAEEEKEAIESMEALNAHLKKFPPEAAEKSWETVDMSHVLDRLKSVEGKKKPSEKPEACWKYQEMYAPGSLRRCQDVLAQDFLKVWGYESEESEEEDEIFRAHEKVLEWMEKI